MTEIKAELQEDNTKISSVRVQVYGEVTDMKYNNAYVRSVNNKQFNKPNNGYII